MSEIWNLSTLCRCCHADGYFKSLNLLYQGKKEVERYEIMLRETLGITISKPPQEGSYTICDMCILKLRDATDFKKQVFICEQKFKVYCTNEQFLYTQETVKLELDIDNDGSNQDNNIHNTDGKPSQNIKEEYNIEVDIKHPIEEVKIDEHAGRKSKYSRKITNKVKRGAPYFKIDHSLVVQVKSETAVNYSCRACGGCYQTKKQIHSHIYQEHSPPLKCEHCSKQFQTPAGYRNHIKLHTGQKFECEHCGKLFGVQKTLDEHINSHTREIVYTCGLCQKDFMYKQTLRKHLKWHAGANKVKLCDLCGRSFTDQSNLAIHIQTVHEKQRPHTCNLCGKTYTAKKHLKYHLQSHIGEKSHKCDVCERKFACPKTMKIHRLTHDNKFMCKYCSKVFEDRPLYISHVRAVHQVAHPCSLCGKQFTSKYSLNRHMDDHKGIKRFSCEICQIKFSQKTLLVRHNFRKHNPDKVQNEKSKCDICKKSFKNIQSHMRSHNDRRYACDICGKTYPENKTLTRHKLQKHFGRTFDCDLCGKQYMQRYKLATHSLKVHKLKKEVPDSFEGS